LPTPEEDAELLARRGSRNSWGSEVDEAGNVIRMAHPKPPKH
jgi:hypothetical protein